MGRLPRRPPAVLAVVVLALGVSTPAAAHAAEERSGGARHSAAWHRADRSARADGLSDISGLTITIDDVTPAVLHPDERLKVTGTVSSAAAATWVDAKVYVSMSFDPVATKTELAEFALSEEEPFGTTVQTLGYFDEIGDVAPGARVDYKVALPPDQLPISGATGVYHLGVSVLASEPDGVRDGLAEDRADTLLPLIDDDAIERACRVIVVLPITAPVARRVDGSFVDDKLSDEIAVGGRLRNLLDFAGQAPSNSIDLAVDPAVLSALQVMAAGYTVRPFDGQPGEGEEIPGGGKLDAAAWLSDFDAVSGRQNVLLLPWGNPDSSSLADSGVSGVVDAAVRASRRFADHNPLPSSVLDWQNNGASSRRGLSVAGRAGANLHLVSQNTLTRLGQTDENGYPPSLVSVATTRGPLTTTVARSDIAGDVISPTTTGLEFRQDLLAEATVRALSSSVDPATVLTTPFHWDPGPRSSSLDLITALATPVVNTSSLLSLTQNLAVPYAGPVQVSTAPPGMSTEVLAALQRLRDTGRVYTDMLTDNVDQAATFDQQLAQAGSSVWQWQPRRGEALIRGTTRSMAEQLAKVTVTGPEFVALSSEEGRFPLTVSNGLDVAITVTLQVTPLNPALEFDPLEPIELDPGQKQDIEVVSRADGSGVTAVRARLATTTDRSFGAPWDFDIRATKIGLAIWILLGVLGAALFSSAVVRIVRRARAGGFTPRGEQER